MILTFKPQFVQKIIYRLKYHTIRKDKADRWKRGRKIDFWCGSPRAPHKNPFRFATGVCQYTHAIQISWLNGFPNVWFGEHKDALSPFYFTNSHTGSPTYGANQMLDLAQDGGFNSIEEFFKFFNEKDYGNFKGKIIYW